LSLPEGATIASLFEQLSLRRSVEVALNGEIEDNQDKLLQDGDRLEFFRAAAGGQRRCLCPTDTMEEYSTLT
jgi:sulfur carrier protein ThiS